MLYFQRNITDIEEYLRKGDSKLVQKYIDLDRDGKIDETVKSMLDELKNVKIPSKLSFNNIFKFDVKIII